MRWSPRTYLRLFLLGAGLLVFGTGLLTGESLQLLVGAAGVVLGGVGLVLERRATN